MVGLFAHTCARDQSFTCSVMSDSLRAHGLQPSSLLYPWNSPGQNTGVGCHFFFQGILQTQGFEPASLVPPAFCIGRLFFITSSSREAQDYLFYVSRLKIQQSILQNTKSIRLNHQWSPTTLQVQTTSREVLLPQVQKHKAWARSDIKDLCAKNILYILFCPWALPQHLTPTQQTSYRRD